jgi:hypothetical protein
MGLMARYHRPNGWNTNNNHRLERWNLGSCTKKENYYATRSKAAMLGSSSKERWQALETSHCLGVALIMDLGQQLNRHLADVVKRPPVALLPDLPWDEKHEGVEIASEGGSSSCYCLFFFLASLKWHLDIYVGPILLFLAKPKCTKHIYMAVAVVLST